MKVRSQPEFHRVYEKSALIHAYVIQPPPAIQTQISNPNFIPLYENSSAFSAAFSANSAVKSFSHSNLEFQFHSVIRKLHIVRQIRIGFFVRQIMADVSEKS